MEWNSREIITPAWNKVTHTARTLRSGIRGNSAEWSGSVAAVVALRRRSFIHTSVHASHTCAPSVSVPHESFRSSSSSIGVPRGWLYLTSDRPPAPLPFPVPRRPCSYRLTRKDSAGGKGRHRLYPERGVLCATCVTVVGGYQDGGSRGGYGDSTPIARILI